MIDIFVKNHRAFLGRDEKVSREMLNAKDVDCFWRQAVDAFNSNEDLSLNENLFSHHESYPEELQELDPYHRLGYTVTIMKMKKEFRNLRSILTKVYFNWKRSRQGDKDDDRGEYDGPIENVFASNFVAFC